MNQTKYFRHDCNARNDDKLTELRIEHGPAGYGVYFMLLERLREEDDYRGEMTDRYIKALAYDFHADPKLIRSVICDFGLFQVDEKTATFSSARFTEQMQYVEELSRKRHAAINKRWSQATDTNESENDTIVSKNGYNSTENGFKMDTIVPKTDSKRIQLNKENAKVPKMTTKDTDGQQKTQNTIVSKNDTIESKNDTIESILYPSKIPPHTPLYNKTKQNIDDDELNEGRNEGKENFLMPDETPEAQALRTRLESIAWPREDIDEFMRMADYAEQPKGRAIQMLEQFETASLKYEPTDYTPYNIMLSLMTEERSGTLTPRVSRQALKILKDLRCRRDIAGSVKNQVRAWLEGAPDRQCRSERTDKLASAMKDIDSGKINYPDAFLIAIMKKA